MTESPGWLHGAPTAFVTRASCRSWAPGAGGRRADLQVGGGDTMLGARRMGRGASLDARD